MEKTNTTVWPGPWTTAAYVACSAIVWGLYQRSRKWRLEVDDETTQTLLDPKRWNQSPQGFHVGWLLGLDIGGSLSKLVFLEPDPDVLETFPEEHQETIVRITEYISNGERYGSTGVRDADLSLYLEKLGGTLHFIRFETTRVCSALTLINQMGFHRGLSTLYATGGGSHKFAEDINRQLKCDVKHEDEMSSLITGLVFLLQTVPDETYTYRGHEFVTRPSAGVEYPYLVVNVGSGVSILLVESPERWSRVSGSSIGGGTYYGLCHMLTGVTSFDEMLELAEEGDSTEVDLTVGDIYGGSYGKVGLSKSTIASSFGRAIHAVPKGHTSSLTHGRGPVVWDVEKVEHDIEAARQSKVSRRGLFRSNSSFTQSELEKHYRDLQWEKWLHRAKNLDERESKQSNDSSVKRNNRNRSSSAGGISESSSNKSDVDRIIDPLRDADTPEISSEFAKSPAFKPNAKHICKGLLIMISNNLGQVAYLNAQRYQCKRIFFAGSFLRHYNTMAMKTLSYAIHFWSGGEMEALFLRHEGYFGSVGTFLSTPLWRTEEYQAAQNS